MYLCLDCTKNVDKNWNINISFSIHVNFDHAWAGHYPVTLNHPRNDLQASVFSNSPGKHAPRPPRFVSSSGTHMEQKHCSTFIL